METASFHVSLSRTAQQLPSIPMVGVASTHDVPTDPPPYSESQTSENVPQLPMTDDDAITWFRDIIPKRYKCESCFLALNPAQLIYQVGIALNRF